MKQDEIDILWQKAMQESIKDGEMFTRYHFAKLVAEKALAEHAMREVQRLGQEIEQEPVAWWNDTGTHIDLNVSGRGAPLYTAPPQRTWVGLTDKDWKRSKHNYDFQKGVDWAEPILKQKNGYAEE